MLLLNLRSPSPRPKKKCIAIFNHQILKVFKYLVVVIKNRDLDVYPGSERI
jgi:hypothetical protein